MESVYTLVTIRGYKQQILFILSDGVEEEEAAAAMVVKTTTTIIIMLTTKITIIKRMMISRWMASPDVLNS